MKLLDPNHRLLPIAAALLILSALVEVVLADGPADPRSSAYSNAHHLNGGADPCLSGADRFNPAYEAGVDIQGRRVVPADTPYSNNASGIYPDPYFEISRRVPGLPGRRRVLPVGEVGVSSATGLVTFNGVPLNAAPTGRSGCADALAGASDLPPLK